MNKKMVISELYKIRESINNLIKLVQDDMPQSDKISDNRADQLLSGESNQRIDEIAEHDTPETDTGGMADIIDMSDTLKNIYLFLLKSDDMTMQEIKDWAPVEDKDMLPILIKTLIRQGHLERIMGTDGVRYSVKHKQKGKKRVSEDIWNMLDKNQSTN